MSEARIGHIGIVACSAEGAALCYTSMCQQAAVRLRKNNHPRITMDSIPLADWMPAFTSGDYEQVGEVMLRSAELLAAAAVRDPAGDLIRIQELPKGHH
jgi:aspartate racemase